MASVSFQTPEKMNDENKPLARTPLTPNSHKIQDLGRTSSQKRARQIFDSLRSLKSRGKPSNDVGEEDAQPAGTGSPIRRRNSTWDLFGTIRSRKSNEFSILENERPLTTTPSKPELQINRTSEPVPKRRKSLINILESISNKASPRRAANSRENPLDEEVLPEYYEEDVFAKKLAKELVDLNLDNLNCTHESTPEEQSRFPRERVDVSHSLEADHNKLIDNFKIRQLEDLLNDRDGHDAKSWTSQAQTLQNEESSEQLASQTPTTEGDRSRTPDSYLCSIIKSFDDYNCEQGVPKADGATTSSSPSPDRLRPTKPIDFLKDLSPDVIPDCQSVPSDQCTDKSSSIVFYAEKPEPSERICRDEKQPIITIREITSDSDPDCVYEDAIAPSPQTWQDAAKSRNSMLKSRARLPDQNSAPYVQEVEPRFVNQREERKDHWQDFEPTPFNAEKSGQVCHLLSHTEERKSYHQDSIEPLSVNETEEKKDHCQGSNSNPPNTEESDLQRIARNIKQTVDKMTKNLHLLSFSEETIEDWDDEPPRVESYPSELEYKYSLSYDQKLDDLTKTVEDLCTKTQEETPAFTMVRKNIALFKDAEFLMGPIDVRYPQSDTKWRHVQSFPTGSLALAEVRKQNQGQYSDTITYCPEKSCIYLHLWGELPKLETDLCVRVRYPETKTRWARTQTYDNGDLAMADLAQHDLEEFSEIRYDASERCFHVYAWDDVVETPNCGVRVDCPEENTRPAGTQMYTNKDLEMADMYQQSHEEFSEVRYNASEHQFRDLTWGEVVDSPDSDVRVDSKEPEVEQNVSVDYPETKTRCARTEMYETEDLATADIYRTNNGEYSKFSYGSHERKFRVEAQPQAIEQAYRTREPAWRPTLSPLGDRDESEQDLPDFSDLEDGFQPVATESLRSSSPGIQSQEGVEGSIVDDNSGGIDMSLFVEAGTPRKVEGEFVAELFMGNQSDNSMPLLRGSKQILQYLDRIDGRDSASKITNSEDGLQSDRRTATQAWAESRSTENAPQAFRDKAEEVLAKITYSVDHDGSSDNETTSLGVKIVEDESRKNSNSYNTQEFQFSSFADMFGEGEICGISIAQEVSEDLKEGIDLNMNPNITLDFDRDVVHRRERSNAICGENIMAPSFEGMLSSEEPLEIMPSEKSNEGIYILPIDNIDMYEENAGCGDMKSYPSNHIDENIAVFSRDADLIGLVSKPIDQSPEPINSTLPSPSYKIDTHLWSVKLNKSDFEGETEQTGLGPGLWAGTRTKSKNIHTAPACTISSASNIEQVKDSGINHVEPDDSPTKETHIEDVTLLEETVSQEHTDNEARPMAITRDNLKRIPTLVNVFHPREIVFPAMPPCSNRPYVDGCASPNQSITNPKRESLTPRIVTPSGKVYSPAKEEQSISNPIQRVQTPGASLGRYMNKFMMSGDETDISDGFGEELEKMGVAKVLFEK
ncbi:hypothetical protein DSL72_003968 [Monilinia vaccinii-corymbosi]|uniref:Uncharacterized protein n=1 Tax=Monilinia vaccinii-corymbosi TaxID=61207 RepID=A0A8A3P107_9HELO|nr:hypothetical protein DSL72_003968 [Monilinia vaccinii-corymbosi]